MGKYHEAQAVFGLTQRHGLRSWKSTVQECLRLENGVRLGDSSCTACSHAGLQQPHFPRRCSEDLVRMVASCWSAPASRLVPCSLGQQQVFQLRHDGVFKTSLLAACLCLEAIVVGCCEAVRLQRSIAPTAIHPTALHGHKG